MVRENLDKYGQQMNRIVLIGNGFDLAHGLKTRYQDFIDWYWEQRIYALGKEYSKKSSDILCTLKLDRSCPGTWHTLMFENGFLQVHDWKWYCENILKNHNCCEVIFSPLLKLICQSIETKNWVDIENEYYALLKWYIFNEKFTEEQKLSLVKQLDQELAFLQQKLVEYLKSLSVDDKLFNPSVRDALYSPIAPEEVCVAQKEWFAQKKAEIYGGDISLLMNKLSRYYLDSESKYTIALGAEAYQQGQMDEFESRIRDYEENLWALPDQILFLSFNYTNTIDLYCTHHTNYFTVNHIHGSLDNPESVIFGYGDELDEKYKEIQNENNNDYLRNIKSIRYLESDNYRKMLEFIDSDKFQVYVVGHSCGNSDRTLLNTLFEHKNCISIKPFYYTWAEKDKDGNEHTKDNYLELVQNISRNFTDMKLMRDRVVNKTYCKEITK